jgi:hypothetical protein
LSALNKEDTMTVAEWLAFSEAPDIILEKEMVWPVEPELIY